MSAGHKLRIVMPGVDVYDGAVYIDDSQFPLPLQEIHVSIAVGQATRITAVMLPLDGLDALLTFSEENPLVVDIHWPKCPHCGKLYDELTEEKSPFEWGEDHWRANASPD